LEEYKGNVLLYKTTGHNNNIIIIMPIKIPSYCDAIVVGGGGI
jgi:hypothetical protein